MYMYTVFYYSFFLALGGRYVRAARPNIVILLADDLGIGDVGCFGNTTISTPNIDSIGKDGAVLTHHISAAAVCTPSRAALLTGRYPVRSGMESHSRNKVIIVLASRGGLPTNETTFAKVLQQSGYATGYFGKWHLGLYCSSISDPCHHPMNHGFDTFYGLPLTNLKDFGDDGDSVVTTYYPRAASVTYAVLLVALTSAYLLLRRGWIFTASLVVTVFVVNPLVVIFFVKNIAVINGVLMRDYEVVEQPVRLPGMTQRLVAEAEKFVHSAVELRKPFLLFLSFVHVHTALFTHPLFAGRSAHGRYGDNVEELDWGVGQILQLLRETGQESNTLVYFSSDNGGHIQEVGLDGQREGGYNGIYRGGKMMGGWEGGIRIPTVMAWPGKIRPGHRVAAATSQMDLLPTVLEAAGAQHPDADRVLDGASLMPLLRNETQFSSHRFLFHYCGVNIHAVRYIPEDNSGVWKVHYHTPDTSKCPYVCHCQGSHIQDHNPPLVYHLDTDPSEQRPLSANSDPRVGEVLAAADAAVRMHRGTVERVPQQFSFQNSFWLPWLQPCCNFPRCSCRENVDIERDFDIVRKQDIEYLS
ncbi:steryl-sulfatase-like isoform X2 [Ornithodoros turicata]|uniref:steryl-sulfatase-like isoform X2 n=2 Tax=Ornithodoros turicata TaxID=34597 RepID=UPI0031387F2F